MRDIRKVRGYTKEIEFCKKVSKRKGIYTFRTPVSGSRNLPDVFFIDSYSKTIYCVEVKSTTRSKIKIKRSQIVRLLHFCRSFKTICECIPLISIYTYNNKKWYVLEVKKNAPFYSTAILQINDNGIVVLKGEEFLNQGIKHSLWIERLLNLKRKRFR